MIQESNYSSLAVHLHFQDKVAQEEQGWKQKLIAFGERLHINKNRHAGKNWNIQPPVAQTSISFAH